MSLFITHKKFKKIIKEIKYVFRKMIFRKRIFPTLREEKKLEMLISQLLASPKLDLVFKIGHKLVHSTLAI